MTRSFFRDAVGALLVFDVCDSNTFANIRGWLEDFRVSS
jgi:GTPase SAR1 family protein